MKRAYDPVTPPVVLTVAGSDAGGGAGIQADLKTMTTHDVFGTSVITATTAQNTRGVHDVHAVPAEHVVAQYDAVIEDFPVAAIKTGMLANVGIVEAVTDRLTDTSTPLVVDPVMVAATGDRLLSPDAEAAYDALIRRATLVTPNADEAAVLVGEPVDTLAEAEAAGRTLVERGADAALIKGGHLDGDAAAASADGGRIVHDTLVLAPDGASGAEEAHVRRFENPRIDTVATHGSGCTLSAAIAARLARGEALPAAVEAAIGGMSEAIRRGYDVGRGPGPVNPTMLDR